jgi:hypothetical protein
VYAAAGVLAVTLVIGGALAPAARAEEAAEAPYSGEFQAVAKASGFRQLFGSPGRFALDYYADSGSPVAETLMNGVGTSTALASAPYPGATAANGSGTLAGFTGLPNPGDYPFFVQSSFPATPKAERTFPGLQLTARSDELSSSAVAMSGGSGPGALIAHNLAEGVVRATEHNIGAQARSVTTGIAIGDVLRIAEVRATAAVKRGPHGETQREDSFDVTGVFVAGQAVALSQKGFTVAGTSTPLPDSSPMREALREHGISVRYLQAVETADGVVSSGLIVSQTMAGPDGGAPVVLELVLGQASASISSTTAASTSDAG